MQDIQKVLCWIFAFTALLYVLSCCNGFYTINRHYSLLTLRNLLVSVLFPGVVASVTGGAWWSILKQEPSARIWGIAASLAYILIFLQPVIFSLRSAWSQHVGALFIGIVGLFTFLWRDRPHDPGKNPRESSDYGSRGLGL